MPLLRVDRHDRVNTVVNAARVIADQGLYVFQVPHGADGEAWRTQYRIPMRDVATITRRVTERTGAVGWATEAPRRRETTEAKAR